ncbi:MAG: Fe2+-dependent dioxygenase [Bacteroidia bacterium]|nr:Fe2+-dependent dioxygenase [Bacteroidia bacterium]
MNTQPYVILDNLLTAQQLTALDSLISAATFGPIDENEGDQIRRNLQISPDDRQILPQIQQLLNQALVQQPMFQALFMPLRMSPFGITRYDQGHGYSWHIDHPMMGNPPLRTDLAMTIFLSEPTSCQGGELEIDTGAGIQKLKPARGSAVVYSCNHVHRVAEVTSGRRIAAISWIQCAVRQPQQRDILFNLQRVYQSLGEKGQHAQEANVVLQTWSNLMRMWSES